MGVMWYCIDDPPCQVNIHTFLNLESSLLRRKRSHCGRNRSVLCHFYSLLPPALGMMLTWEVEGSCRFVGASRAARGEKVNG